MGLAVDPQELTPTARACACDGCRARADLAAPGVHQLQITSFFCSTGPHRWTVMVSLEGSIRVIGHGDLEEEALQECLGELRELGALP